MADVFYAKQTDYIFRLNKMAADLQAAFTQVQADWNAITGPTVIQNKPILAAVATSGLKSDVGLGNVDNTSDANKPVSSATQTALNLKATSTTLAAQGGGALIGNTPAGSISATTVQAAINELATEKEPAITAGTTAQYFRGDKSFQDLAMDVRAAPLTALSVANSTSVVATDSVLVAAGKLQAQVNTNSNRIGDLGSFGSRNRIINGSCAIAQRPTLTFATNTGGYAGPDRFYASNSNAGGSFSQSLNSITFGGITQNSVRQTVVSPITSMTGTNLWFGITQVIEGVNCFDLKNKPITLSFIFNSNLSGTYSVIITDSTRSVTFLSSFVAVANTPIKVIVKAPAVPNAAVIPNTGGGGLSISIGAVNQGTYAGTAASFWQTSTLLTVIGATSWGATANNFIEVTEVQLEPGTIATEFERKSYTAEFTLCQRYFQRIITSFQSYCASGFFTSQQVYFNVPLRITPTVTRTSAAPVSCTLVGPEEISMNSFRFTVQATATATVYVNSIVVLAEAEF